MAVAPALRPLSIGEVLDLSFGLYRSLFAPLLVVAAICQLVPVGLQVYLTATGGMLIDIPLTLLTVLLAIILGALGSASSTFIVSDAYLGRETSAAAALGRATALLGRLIVISILSSLLIGIGFVLLIVPGLIVLSALILSTVTAVLESSDTATAAMGRSWELSRGFRNKILVTMVVAFLFLLAPGIAVGALDMLFGGADDGTVSFGVMVLQSVLEVVIRPYVYVVMTVLYYDLRVRKEGFDLEHLASSLAPR